MKKHVLTTAVLAGAFAIQLVALTTPLFSQVVIDKVLTHRSFSTLHVLAFGMLAVIVFDAVLGILKSQLLAHASNRIQVVLGGRLLAHVLRIPLRYFELRRVGDTVARAREIDQVRLPFTPDEPGAPPPRQGEHTEIILREAGLDDARIAELRAAGAIPA